MGEFRAFPCSVAHLVKETSDNLLAAVFEKKFVHPFPDTGLLRMRYELPVLPPITVGRCPASGLPELGADGDGSGHAVTDFLALPLRHGGDKCVEQPPCWARGVDGFLKRDELGVVFPEVVGEV